MKTSPRSRVPLDVALLLVPPSSRREKLEETVARLSELYLRTAYTDPESVSTREIRLLRRSRWAMLRAAAVVLWAQRRPLAFLGAAERFLRDVPAVRCAVLEALATAVIVEGRIPAESPLDTLLKAGLEDPDPNVRAAARETAAVFQRA